MIMPIAVLTLGTLTFRLIGPMLRTRVTLSARAERMASIGVAVIFVALVATSALVANGSFAGLACATGVLVAVVLAWRKAPFVVIVVAAAAVTGGLRYVGVT